MTPTIRRILLPTNFGPSSACAAAYAGALARGLGASIRLIHVVEPPAFRGGWQLQRPDAAAIAERLYDECREKLEALAALLHHAPDRITIEVRAGTPAECIADAAVEYSADLIVMSTPDRRALPEPVLGTVTDRVIHAAPCPVLAVRPSGAARVHPTKRAASRNRQPGPRGSYRRPKEVPCTP